MGIFSRLADIINSNLNSILDRAEEPEKIIRLVIQEMEDTLVEVRSTAAKTIAERKEATRRLARLAETQKSWEQKAELALRSEEHTSELQSLMRISYAVFCLKKKHK